MDAISLLNGVKNKVLDAKNYELLKHTYDLQNQNIEQLKTSNEGFREDNERLREEVNGLKGENESLKQTVAQLTQRVSKLNGGGVPSGLPEVAVAILDLYHRLDKTELYKESQIFQNLDFTKIKVESAIDELITAKMIGRPVMYVVGDSDTLYPLTKLGKKYLAEKM